MRILYLQHESKLWGTARSLLALIDELRAQGHDCYVLLHEDGPLRQKLHERQIPSAIFRWRSWLADKRNTLPRRFLHGLRCMLHSRLHCAEVLGRIGDFQPDLVHSNTIKTDLGGPLAQRFGVPHIWHMRELVGSRYPVGTEWSLGLQATAKQMSRHGAATICISNALSQSLKHTALSIPIYTVYNGVMTRSQMLDAVSPLPSANGRVQFAFIGRFDDLKDPLTALRAMAILQGRKLPCRLLLAGDGTPQQKTALQQFIEQHGLEHCIAWSGFVSNISAFLKGIHALVMPSRGDAFGRVTAEAMAHGRPVLGANAGATPELVRDRIDGFLFAPGHAETLADRMQAFIESPASMAQMGQNAAQRALAEFTNEKYAAAIVNIYEEVLLPSG